MLHCLCCTSAIRKLWIEQIDTGQKGTYYVIPVDVEFASYAWSKMAKTSKLGPHQMPWELAR